MPLIVFLIILIPFNIFTMPIIYKKLYNVNKSLQQYQKIKITENFISITTETENTNLIKSNVNRIEYDKDSIYVFVGLRQYIMKKRFLENENDFERMVNFVKIYYGKDRKCVHFA
jgi:hypothetical protein